MNPFTPQASIFKFYGVDGNMFKLDKNVFEVIENPDDGYRSSMDEVKGPIDVILLEKKPIFFRTAVDTVSVRPVNEGDFDGFELVSTDDSKHVWLRFGTDMSDDYYPCFRFEYNAKASAEILKAEAVIAAKEVELIALRAKLSDMKSKTS